MITVKSFNNRVTSIGKSAAGLKNSVAEICNDALTLVYGLDDSATAGTTVSINKLIEKLAPLPAIQKPVIAFLTEHIGWKFDSKLKMFTTKQRGESYNEKLTKAQAHLASGNTVWNYKDNEPKPVKDPSASFVAAVKKATKTMTAQQIVDSLVAAGLDEAALIAAFSNRRVRREQTLAQAATGELPY